MIQIPPNLPDPSAQPKRAESVAIQAVPAVLADKPGVNPGVVLNLPLPVLETPTDGLRPRDATNQPGATQIDNETRAAAVRQAPGAPNDEVAVRQGLSTAGLPDRLVKLLAQLESLSGKTGAPVMWPQAVEVRAARPEQALLNLRRALGNSMLFEMRRLQARLVPSAVGGPATFAANPAAASTGMAPPRAQQGFEADAALVGLDALPDFQDSQSGIDGPATGGQRVQPNFFTPASITASGGTPLTPPAGGAATNKDVPVHKGEPQADAVDGRDGVSNPVVVDEEPEAAQALLPQRADALTTDSQVIKDAVRLLLHGELRWQGELSPGVFARLQREDVWEEDPHSPGALVKGTLVSVDLDLPSLGRLRVRGMFIKDSVRVTMLPQEDGRGALQAQLQDLRERLTRRGLEGAQVRLAEGGDV